MMKTSIFFCLLLAFSYQGNADQCATFVNGILDTVIALKTNGSVFDKIVTVTAVIADFKSGGKSCKGLTKAQYFRAIQTKLKTQSVACDEALASLVEGIETNIDKKLKGFKAFAVVAKVIPEIMMVAGTCRKN